ncbi:hypothetical protein ACN1C3_13520 [Pseudomonas sp. H11T01]|uniref:hypothetical protein n=1 Tax=Pseudomonas sp. H11T01 TaxID=3402749 RepID=UPI003AD5CB39
MNVAVIVLTLCVVGFSVTSVHAIEEEVTAVFKPDPANPQVNKFENTTPVSSICEVHIPTQCQALNIFSLRNTGFRAYSNSPIPANHALMVGERNPRQGAMFKVPSQWRAFQVTHEKSGEVETVEMRMAGIGSHWRTPRPPGVSAWALPGRSWSEQWRYPSSPCVATGFFTADSANANFFWIVSEDAGACVAFPGIELSSLEYRTLEYAYELRTPKPLEMSTGQYRGSLTYSMGPGGDFDFGDIMIPTDTQMTFNFTLDVQHTLKVEVPPGGNNIQLVPQGGWQAWLNQGRKPTRLFRDQTFNISASSRFKMGLECQYWAGGNTCNVYDSVSGHSVPVNVSVSLPSGLVDETGSSVSRRPLRRDGVGTELFQPVFYVDRKPGILHFEIPAGEVAEMIHPGTARQYSGNVTVIWDSEVG